MRVMKATQASAPDPTRPGDPSSPHWVPRAIPGTGSAHAVVRERMWMAECTALSLLSRQM